MKKKVLPVIACAMGILVLWMVASGFAVQTSAYITDDFSVYEDGSEMRFSVGVKPHYLKFYSARGGFNSSIGAKNEFVLQLSPDDTEIYVYHGDGGYELALEKIIETGEWHRKKSYEKSSAHRQIR